MSIIDPTKRERKNLTKAVCEARVTRQTKTHDAKVGGLYVSVSPKSGARVGCSVDDPRECCPERGLRMAGLPE